MNRFDTQIPQTARVMLAPAQPLPSERHRDGWTSLSWVFLGILFLASFFISTIAPPFQSPDEFDHVKRAYLLSQGVVLLKSNEGQPSGGRVDSGLLEYMSFYRGLPLKPDVKVTEEKVRQGSTVRWTGSKKFTTAAGTGYYFPAVYMPQAIGLSVGRWLGLSVDMSYRLARMAALSVVIVLLALSVRHFPLPPVVIAMLAIPMTLFQMSAASLDGVSTALSILAISLFARIAQERQQARSLVFYALAVTVFLVASSRAHLLPMLLLVFAAAFFTRRKTDHLIALALTVVVGAWMLLAIKTTVPAKNLGNSATEMIGHYLRHPTAFFDILGNTLGNSYLQTFYARTFVGVLGWLDAPLQDGDYAYLYALLALPLLASIHLKSIPNDWQARSLLAVCGAASVLLVFFALLVQWTPQPATMVDGVQGRYFLVPAIFLAYALALRPTASNRVRMLDWGSAIALGLLVLLSVANTSSALTARYYVRGEVPEIVRGGSNATGHYFGELTPGRSFSQTFTAQARYMYQARLFLATFARQNSGTVRLAILDETGRSLFQSDFDVSKVGDNEWHNVQTDGVILDKGGRYQLRIVSIDGSPGNAITWWASSSDSYDGGHAIVDSSATDRDFAFELVYLH